MKKLIKKLSNIHKKQIELNKTITDFSIAVVPSLKAGKMPINQLDTEEDFIYFCFAKFTKSLLSIQTLLNAGFYEDALTITRSNYECFINAKSIIASYDKQLIDQFVQFTLGKETDIYEYNSKTKILYQTGTDKKFKYIGASFQNIATNHAKEEWSYYNIYSYLCEMAHCNFKTSGYYRDGSRYSYSLKNEIAKLNVLFWNCIFNIKFYKVIIDSEIIDNDELNSLISNEILGDQLLLLEVHQENKTEFNKNILSNNDVSLDHKNYLETLESIKNYILTT